MATTGASHKLDLAGTVRKLCVRHNLVGSDQVVLARFGQAIDAAVYEPVSECEVPELRHEAMAGHQMNVIEGNHGTPLARAKSDLLVACRVPAQESVKLLVAFGFS